MKSIKKIIPTLALLLFSVSVIFAQISESGVSEEVAVAQPSWIANPIGSIIGLILMVAMFAGMAKVALAKE